MKRVLIISPYFPPANAADMQRIRMSLPYFKNFGWDAEVVTVDPQYIDHNTDDLLLQSLPQDVKVHYVKAFNKATTNKVGLGSLALRSIWFYKQKVDKLLKAEKYDLIYFSTTQFPVCVLGAYWKSKFNIPYVIDVQDPWYSDYYQDKPKSQRPPKHWFSHRLNKYLEPRAVKNVAGLISVSPGYIDMLKSRYFNISAVPAVTIPFGFYEPDMEIAQANQNNFKSLLSKDTINVVYVGRGGADMHLSITPLFSALKNALAANDEAYKKLRFYFIGTSYAPAGYGQPTVLPLAKQFGVENNVIEITDRISFYHTLITLQQADALFVPGSDDANYTASKLYPYLLTYKPLLAIFNPISPAIKTLHSCGVADAYDYKHPLLSQNISRFLNALISGTLPDPVYNHQQINEYSAENMTRKQCELFDQAIAYKSPSI